MKKLCCVGFLVKYTEMISSISGEPILCNQGLLTYKL